MDFKVSVIIPCYNAEDTIERAINSVINQTIGFENIELLLYDDASTDNTPNILKKFSNKFDNIIAICSNENSGRPSRGRNVCIEKASSEFLMFMDNDDEYDENICKNLYTEIVTTNSELVTCSFINMEEFNNKYINLEYFAEKSNIEGNNIVFAYPNIFYFNNIYVWNSIFRKKIVKEHKIYFPENEFAEDVSFSQNYKLYVSKLVYLKDYFGVYRHVDYNSLSNSFNLDDLKEIHESQENLYNQLKNYNYIPLDYVFKNHILMSLIRLYKSNSLDYPKEDIIIFLKKLRDFEIKLNINYSFGIIINLINYFLKQEKYYIVLCILRLLRQIYKFKLFRNVYDFF